MSSPLTLASLFCLVALLPMCAANTSKVGPGGKGVFQRAPWTPARVSFCFADPRHVSFEGDAAEHAAASGFSEARKTEIRDAVLAEFTRSRTGVHFVDLGECHESPDADVWVLRSRPYFDVNDRLDARNAAHRLGQSEWLRVCTTMDPEVEASESECHVIEGYDPSNGHWGTTPVAREGFRSFVYLNTDVRCQNAVEPGFCRRATMVHEFGHIAGLMHEHVHPDAANDPVCARYGLPNGSTGGDVGQTAELADYDPHSIMSYCYRWSVDDGTHDPERPGNSWSLSEGDAETLRTLYEGVPAE